MLQAGSNAVRKGNGVDWFCVGYERLATTRETSTTRSSAELMVPVRIRLKVLSAVRSVQKGSQNIFDQIST